MSTKQIASEVGVGKPVVSYYKGLWGFAKKRRSRKTTTTAAQSEALSISAFKRAYDSSSIINKAILLNNLQEWIKEETAKLNGLK